MRSLVIITAIILVLGVVGCAALPLESTQQKPVSMTKMSDSQGTKFFEQKLAIWLFWGAIPVFVPNVDDIVGSKVSDHAGVQNLKITTKYDFINFLLTGLTDGIIYSQTITIEGQVYD